MGWGGDDDDDDDECKEIDRPMDGPIAGSSVIVVFNFFYDRSLLHDAWSIADLTGRPSCEKNRLIRMHSTGERTTRWVQFLYVARTSTTLSI